MVEVSEDQIKPFKSDTDWEEWLSKHFEKPEGIWIKFAKKDSGIPTVTYDEALDVALCYGWIDGLSKRYDETYYIQKFTPRRAKSLWSKRNVGKIAELTKAKRMKPSGLAEVERAKADGRWEAAYDGQKDMKIPDDFLTAVKKNTKTYEFFQTLNKSNLFAIGWRLQTAKKPETRERRFNLLLEMMEKGEKPY